MAGVKGRSGGPRPNSGGYRPGSGPKPVPSRKSKRQAYQTDDPDEFLRAVMADPAADFKDRMAAALALKKSGKSGLPMGKRDQQQANAEGVARGSHNPLPAPIKPRNHLRMVK